MVGLDTISMRHRRRRGLPEYRVGLQPREDVRGGQQVQLQVISRFHIPQR